MPSPISTVTSQPAYTDRDTSISTAASASNTSGTPIDWHETCITTGVFGSSVAMGSCAASIGIPGMASPCGQLAIVAGAISFFTCYVGNLIDPLPEASSSSFDEQALEAEAEAQPNFVMSEAIPMGPQNASSSSLQLPEARLIPTAVATAWFIR